MPVSKEWVGKDILFEIGLCIWNLVVDDTENGFRGIPRLHDFEHGVIVASSLLTHLAEVEVLADRALVSDTDDRLHAASIADHSTVLLLLILRALSIRLFLLLLR
jgi:hypothetical protein